MSDTEEVNIDIELDDEANEDEEAYPIFDITTYPSDLTLSGLKSLWDDGDLIIPKYQRNYVWNINQASLLIESFLLGLPVPQLFFYLDNQNRSLVIDGQQRVTSIAYFLDGYFGSASKDGKRTIFKLKGLNKKSPYLGKTFTDLLESDQRKLKKSVLRAINIKQLSPTDQSTSQYYIFERLNTGGTPLKPQEIRNCVFNGEFVDVLRGLNNNASWRKIIGQKLPNKFQRDIEMLLRVFAFSFYASEYEKPMKEFLNLAMMRNQTGKTKNVHRFVTRFEEACEKILSELGPKPFHVRGPINLAALDSIMSTTIKKAPRIKPDYAANVEKLLADEHFRELIFYNTSDLASVGPRFEITKKILVK